MDTDTENELVSQFESFNPLTDTGRALKFLAQYIIAKSREHDQHLQDVTTEVRAIMAMKKAEAAERSERKNWLKKVLAYALGLLKSE